MWGPQLAVVNQLHVVDDVSWENHAPRLPLVLVCKLLIQVHDIRHPQGGLLLGDMLFLDD